MRTPCKRAVSEKRGGGGRTAVEVTFAPGYDALHKGFFRRLGGREKRHTT